MNIQDAYPEVVFRQMRIDQLEHELALAHASSDYWRTRYIDAATRIERAGALAWFQSLIRTGGAEEKVTVHNLFMPDISFPLENAWDRYTCE
jgi:hypothetical protein